MLSRPLLSGIFAGQEEFGGMVGAVVQMSRKRAANAVTCRDEWLMTADLGEWPFGCFTFVQVDGAGSPREVPENSHC
jgi:hypothetical protein